MPRTELRPTTFVLGAGAHYPYGFPTGRGLVDEVIEWSKKETRYFTDRTGTDCREFEDALAASQVNSIDALVESRLEEFATPGTRIIALQLLEVERKCQSPVNWSTESDAWYRQLFQIWFEEEPSQHDPEFCFVTFNYDRLSEHLIYHALRARFDWGHAQALGFARNNVIHVYGSLGDYDPESFGQDVSQRVVEEASNSIQLANRSIPRSELELRLLQWSRKKVADLSTELIVLGFGYDQMNMDRLLLRHATGTAVEMTETEMEIAAEGRNLKLIPCNCTDLLRAVRLRWPRGKTFDQRGSASSPELTDGEHHYS